MYSFQANTGRRKGRKMRRLLYIIIFVLVIALVGVSFAYVRSTKVADATSDALIARAMTVARSPAAPTPPSCWPLCAATSTRCKASTP